MRGRARRNYPNRFLFFQLFNDGSPQQHVEEVPSGQTEEEKEDGDEREEQEQDWPSGTGIRQRRSAQDGSGAKDARRAIGKNRGFRAGGSTTYQ